MKATCALTGSRLIQKCPHHWIQIPPPAASMSLLKRLDRERQKRRNSFRVLAAIYAVTHSSPKAICRQRSDQQLKTNQLGRLFSIAPDERSTSKPQINLLTSYAHASKASLATTQLRMEKL